MNTEQLRYFQLAYKQGSFSAAARMVPVSHQGLTKGIRNLERELGVTLFDYDSDSGRPEPTPFAHELYDFAVVYEANLHLLNESFERLRRESRYTVRLGCSLGVLGAYGPELLEGFARAHPNIDVPYWESNDALCEQGLLEGKYDMALCVSPITAGCEGKELYRSPMYFWLRADDALVNTVLLRDGKLHAEDLAGRDIAIPGTGFKCLEHLRRYVSSNGYELGHIFDMSEIFQLYGYALDGRGLGFSNGTLVDLPVFQSNAQIIALPVDGLSWGFGIERLSIHVLGDAEQLFWNWCCAAARGLAGNTLNKNDNLK